MKPKYFFVVLAFLALIVWRGNYFTTRVFGFGTVDARVGMLWHGAGDLGWQATVQVTTPGPSYGKVLSLKIPDDHIDGLLLSGSKDIKINLDERGNAILN